MRLFSRLAVLFLTAGSVGLAMSPLAPTITTQPTAKTVNVGQTANFTVVATGGTLTYQWKKNNVNVTVGTGGTTASYTTPATVAADNNTKYKVVVTDATGSVTSTEVTLTVVAITTQPANKSIVVGQTATFTVVATGNSLTYQWRKGGVDIAGATAASYTTPVAVIGDNGGVYSVKVTSTAGTITSANATLTVGAATAPTITTHPASQSAFATQTATFTVVATGSAPLAYQWKKGGVDIAGATAASYTTPVLTVADSGASYTVVVTNGGGSKTSNAAILTVNPVPLPTITVHPTNKSVVAGQTATFTVTATGIGTLTYQWKKGGTNVVGGTGATTASYTTPVTVVADSGSVYTVVVTNSAGPVTSNPATLTVSPLTPPTITVQPVDRTVIVGFPATFMVTATSTAAITYQWSKNGTPIPGATGTSYVTPATTLADDGAVFTVVASNSAGGTTSTPAVLTVGTAASSIPDPWLDVDVGVVGMPGEATLDVDVFTVVGAGANIGGTADAFHFLYQPLTGNGSVVARVTPGTATALAKVGVMIRQTLTANSAMAGTFVTGASGTVFISRTTGGGAATQTAGTPATITTPYWVKLDRTGNVFTGSISPDGTAWTVVSTATIVMPTDVFIGFAVTSADTGALNASTVESFSGTGGWRPALRKPKSGGGDGGGGCGLLGLDGVLLAGLMLAAARGRRCAPRQNNR